MIHVGLTSRFKPGAKGLTFGAFKDIREPLLIWALIAPSSLGRPLCSLMIFNTTNCFLGHSLILHRILSFYKSWSIIYISSISFPDAARTYLEIASLSSDNALCSRLVWARGRYYKVRYIIRLTLFPHADDLNVPFSRQEQMLELNDGFSVLAGWEWSMPMIESPTPLVSI